jgi:BirA family transcriptional regulator, biotin operon repressor / biotin---[acetyl-CoA-carboxylase] ligase
VNDRISQPLLIHLACVDSTQSFLRRHPELGFCAVVADAQSEGRGRQGHRWESDLRAGLWMSAAIPVPPIPAGLLLQRAMLGVIEILASYGFSLGLKWPNDLLARQDGRFLKVGGIIGERSGERLILGLGVNLRFAPELPDRAIPPACLADLATQVPDALDLAQKISAHWLDWNHFSEAKFRWPEEGQAIVWESGQGVVMGWEEDGRLKVTTVKGIERLSAADIRGVHAEALET